MGYKNKKYAKSLTQQIYERLVKMLHDGEGMSKREAIANGTDRNKIFSYSTYKGYIKHCKYFAEYINTRHPECTNLKKARKYVNEREDIKRSRGDAVRDKHFSEKNNDEFVKFCRATGCRRQIMEKLEGRDLVSAAELRIRLKNFENKSELDSNNFIYFCNMIKTQTLSYMGLPDYLKESFQNLRRESGLTSIEINKITSIIEALSNFPDHEYYIEHRSDKGGRYRYAPIIGDYKQQIIDRMQATASNEKVWLHVPGNADIHGYRSDYATMIYKMYARPIDQIFLVKWNIKSKNTRLDTKNDRLDQNYIHLYRFMTDL